MSTLVIGDIHGCYAELQDLLDKAAITEDDQILALGDLFDRGPEPGDVFEFFRTVSRARSTRGNHEAKHLDAIASGTLPPLSQLMTRWYLGSDYNDFVQYVATLPLYVELPDALIVHAYFEPGLPPDQQRPDILLGQPSGEDHLKTTYDRPWFSLYDYDKPIIVGHRDYTSKGKIFNYADRVFGIDTRCVYGGSLTGILLPEWRFVSVPAHENYYTNRM